MNHDNNAAASRLMGPDPNAVARSEFAAILDEPVSARLVSTIWQTPIAAKD